MPATYSVAEKLLEKSCKRRCQNLTGSKNVQKAVGFRINAASVQVAGLNVGPLLVNFRTG